MKMESFLKLCMTACAIGLASASVSHAAPITFSEVTTGLSGTLIFADVSTNGTLVNASTGDQTGIVAGNSNGVSNWGRADSSIASTATTAAGHTDALNSNVLEGIGSEPALKWTFSSGSGDGTNGAGSLLANTTYNIYFEFHTHTSASQNWGIEAANNASFTGFDQYDNNDGTLITTAGTHTTDWRRALASFTVTTDGSGNATLYIRRPTSGTHLRSYLDGVVLQQVIAVPTPAALPAGLGLVGLMLARRPRHGTKG
ncbi:MAG: hypothetical protein GC162_10205 [Planctomycetes bacterium]|nr:hypothetical protein [Planctomycetota bacterium]